MALIEIAMFPHYLPLNGFSRRNFYTRGCYKREILLVSDQDHTLSVITLLLMVSGSGKT